MAAPPVVSKPIRMKFDPKNVRSSWWAEMPEIKVQAAITVTVIPNQQNGLWIARSKTLGRTA